MSRTPGAPAPALGLAAAGVAAIIASRGFGTAAGFVIMSKKTYAARTTL